MTGAASSAPYSFAALSDTGVHRTPPPCGEGQGWGSNDRVKCRSPGGTTPIPIPFPTRGKGGAHAIGLVQRNPQGEKAKPQTPILPPPLLVIATTDGRQGMSGLKSGQRVERSS